MNGSNISIRVWNYATVLKNAGIAYTDYVAQLTYLLFLKMDDERAKAGEESTIPKKYQWNALHKLDGMALETQYNNTLKMLAKQSGIVGVIYAKAQNKISEPAKLKRLISLINEATWLGLDLDIKGAIYESLLQRNATESKGGAGQYFTPRPLINAIVEVMRPQYGMTIYDPACGTGGFLLAAYKYIKDHNKELNKNQSKKLKDNLHGQDIAPLVVTLCAMNMYLHGIGNGESPIECKDSLSSSGNKRYDMILTNPPFGKKSGIKIIGDDNSVVVEKDNYNRDDFIVTTSNKQINFLQHIMTILEINGRAAVVVPDNVLFEGGAGEKVRKRLLNEFNLHTILRLPTGIFYAQGVKANVVFFDKYKPLEKGHRTQDVWVYDLRTNINITLVTNSLNDNHLKDFIKCYSANNPAKRAESERFKKFSYDEVIARDKTNLDIFWLKDKSLEDLENLDPPEVIIKSIIDNMRDALKSFEKVEKILR